MRRHWSPGRLVVVTLTALLAVVLSLAGGASPAYSSPPATHNASSSASPQMAPTEGNKVTLGDTSVDAPALWTSESGSVRAVIGWTGTDAAHHLNLMRSSDAFSWNSKVTLSDTSPFSPALARTGSNSGDSVVVGWTGTDAHHSLNVLTGDPPSNSMKLTIWQENSFTRPAVALLNGTIYLAWAGTDAQHSLNVDRIVASGGSPQVAQKTTLRGWSSPASAPTLVADPVGQRLLMTWTGPGGQVYFAYSTDGASWTQPAQSPMAEWSDATPMAFSALSANVSSTLPRYFVTWRGINAAHSINVKFTTAFPEWPQSYAKTVLNETSLGGPSLGSTGADQQLILAWTGTDAAHHLNVAAVGVAYAAACVPAAGVQPVVPDVIFHGTSGRREVAITFDSDGGPAGNATSYLNTLDNYKVQATFFVTGQFAQANPTIVQRIVSDGMDLGNHTFDHSDLANPARSDTFVCNELNQADSAIVNDGVHSSRPYFRPPYGSYNEQVQYLAAGLGYRTLYWSIDPRDWDSATTTQDIINRVLGSPNLGLGAIILMHVNSPNEQYALPNVIQGLQQRGFAIVTLSQLLR